MKNSKLFVVICTLLLCNIVKAQLLFGDSAWVKQNSLSEEFTSFPDTVNKWFPRYSWGNINNGAEVNLASNLSDSSGIFIIRADTLTTPVFVNPSPWGNPPWVGGRNYRYSGGAIVTKDTSYKFGYIEIYAKYPTGSTAFWPAFWFLNIGCNSGVPWYNEIDACENGADESFNENWMGTNWHVYDNPPPNCNGWDSLTSLTTDGASIQNLSVLSAAYNKFGIEWRPDRMNWYFNDQLVRTVIDANVPKHGMAFLLNFAINPWYTRNDWNSLTPPDINFPAHIKIDYMRYYKLTSDCSNDQTISCPVNPSNIRAVKKSISTDNTCTPTFNISDNITLRATDYILFNEGATINASGSGTFTADITTCPN